MVIFMKKVVLGMSGGVDSSSAAIILKEQGYELIGLTYKLTDDYDPTDAIEVCKKLNIEHHVIDYRDIFNKEIKEKFISDYENGLTPNPCILCNKKIKFNYLYDFMIKNNCDYIATGHYARIIDGKLYKSEDKNKDQTYFLCEVTKEQLEKVIFPLEGITKERVREIALENGLNVFNKKDSYDVCFITSSFKEYMNNNSCNKKGDVLDVKTKEKVGTHNGLSYYTIGQRRGLDIGGSKERMFVVGKDYKNNILFIAYGDSEYLISDSCIIEDANLLIDEKVDKCSAKFRFRQEETNVELEYLEDNKILVKYPSGVKSVTPGQACTLYIGDQCIGGGIIKEVRKNKEKLWYL